jgi:hypothetical protein
MFASAIDVRHFFHCFAFYAAIAPCCYLARTDRVCALFGFDSHFLFLALRLIQGLILDNPVVFLCTKRDISDLVHGESTDKSPS